MATTEAKIGGWEWVRSEFSRVRDAARAECDRLAGPDRGGVNAKRTTALAPSDGIAAHDRARALQYQSRGSDPVSIFRRNRPVVNVPESSSTVTGATASRLRDGEEWGNPATLFGPWATHETRCKCSVCR